MASYEYKTCRHCLGAKCVHCNHQGEIRRRVFSAGERAAERLRRQLGIEPARGAFQQERDKTLALLRS